MFRRSERTFEARSGHPLVRSGLTLVGRGVLALLARTDVRGREHAPAKGPLIVATNHLGLLDPLLCGAYLPWHMEGMALVDLLRVPGTSQFLRLYGVIPIDRDNHDGGALLPALDALAGGKIVSLQPEGRVSLTAGLERARTGVAYLALSSGVPVLPIAITGSERAIDDWKRCRRPRLTLAIGEPVQFAREAVTGPARHERLRAVADEIMYRIAALLPSSYRGVYATVPPAASMPRHAKPIANR